MIDAPERITTEPVAYAAIYQRIPTSEIMKVMGPTCAEIGRELVAQGIPPSGPWFTHHLERPREFFNFEVCFPVTQRIEPAGRVQPGLWPATDVVRTVYRGSYAGLPAAWGELEQWIKSQGLSAGSEFWEVYMVNPNDTDTPQDWVTQLNWPIAEGA